MAQQPSSSRLQEVPSFKFLATYPNQNKAHSNKYEFTYFELVVSNSKPEILKPRLNSVFSLMLKPALPCPKPITPSIKPELVSLRFKNSQPS